MEDKCGLVMSELCEGVEVTVGEEKIITITIRYIPTLQLTPPTSGHMTGTLDHMITC